MTILNKILIGIGSAILVFMLGYMIYNQEKIKTQQTALQSSIVAQQTLVDGIVRSQSQYATAADLAKFASDNDINMKAIQANMKTLNDQLAAINVITADSTGQNRTNVASTGTGPSNPKPTAPLVVACTGGTATCPNQDPFGFQTKQQNLALNENFANLKVPFGTVGFSAWQQNPWDVQIAPREYNVDTVVGVDVNQRQTFYNKFTVKVNNQTYDIPIKTATTKQVTPTASFSWWNPRLFGTIGGSINVTTLPVNGTFNAGVTLGIMSWGQYKNNPTISVLQVGAGYSSNKNEFIAIVNPVAFNIGKLIPGGLVNNTYVGPSLQLSTSGNIFTGANVSIGF